MQDACLLIKQRSRYAIKKRSFYSLSSLNFSNIMLYLVGCVQNLLSFTIIAVNIYDIAKVNLIRSISKTIWTKVEEFMSFAIKK